MKTVLLVSLLLLTSCTNTNIEKQMHCYCKPCGGIKSSFYNDDGLVLTCSDGSTLTQTYSKPPKIVILGTCK